MRTERFVLLQLIRGEYMMYVSVVRFLRVCILLLAGKVVRTHTKTTPELTVAS